MSNDIEIRPFQQVDAIAVEQILQQLWGHDPTHLSLYRQHRDWQADPSSAGLARHTLVAVEGSTVVGAGTLFESTLHPRMHLLVINVAQEWQRRGIGTKLYDALYLLSSDRQWCAKMTQCDPAGMSFLAKRGWYGLVGTLTGLLDPQAEAVAKWMRSLPASIEGCCIVTFSEPDCPATLDEMASIHVHLYTEAHYWNPPSQALASSAQTIFCDGAIKGSELLAYAGGDLVGAANLITSPFDPASGEAYMVWLGVLERELHRNPDLPAALIRRMLEFAARRNLRVRFEVDSTRHPEREILQSSPAIELDNDSLFMVSK
ncbi:MAG: GNAT family N-acetyltransferase [Chloroflexota bacterium]